MCPPHPPHHHRWSWGVCAFFGVCACVCDCKVSASNCDRLLEQIWRRVSKNKKGRKKGEGAFRAPARPAERCHSAHCKKTDNSVRTVIQRRGFSCLNTRGSVLKWFHSAVHWFWFTLILFFFSPWMPSCSLRNGDLDEHPVKERKKKQSRHTWDYLTHWIRCSTFTYKNNSKWHQFEVEMVVIDFVGER